MRTNGCGMRRMGLVGVVLGAGAMVASADIVDERVIRMVDAEALARSGDRHMIDDPSAIISDDFGLFDHINDADARTDDGLAVGEVLSAQETLADGDQVMGRLATDAVARADGVDAEAFSAGSSSVVYEFTLTDGARFALTGDYIVRDRRGDATNRSSIRLIPLTREDVEPIVIEEPGHFRFLGRLPAGEYRMEAQTHLAMDAFEGVSSLGAVIEFRFGLSECPADINADGELDGDDFFLFLDLFGEDDPSVDFNHDGTIDSADFFAYLDIFVHGC